MQIAALILALVVAVWAALERSWPLLVLALAVVLIVLPVSFALH